jgi:hypothetical protein
MGQGIIQGHKPLLYPRIDHVSVIARGGHSILTIGQVIIQGHKPLLDPRKNRSSPGVLARVVFHHRMI